MKNIAYSYQTSHSSAARHSSRAYTPPQDFCVIFKDDMDSLYSLALVLTGNHETAQQCFLAALDDCCTGSDVFPDWARSWSRRAVIKNAIRLLGPALAQMNGAPETTLKAAADEMDASARPYLELQTFDRFVFVISVLERYTHRECAALLGSSPREVEQAQVRGLQRIAGDGRKLGVLNVVTVESLEQDSRLMPDGGARSSGADARQASGHDFSRAEQPLGCV